MSYPIIEAVSTKELTALASSITINKPTGTAAGDLLIAFASGYNRNTNALNANPSPSGWTDLYYNRQAAFWARSESIISYKVAGASEGTDYTFNFSGDMVPAGKIFRVSNFDIDSIVVASSHHMEDNWDTDPIIATAITATADNLLFFMGCGGRDNASFTPQIGVPGGMDDQGQLRSTKIDSYEDIYHAQRIATEEVGAGATGTRTATNANAQMWHAHLIAINSSGVADPPVLQTAVTDTSGASIILTFDKAMANPSGKHGEFSFQISTVNRTFSAAALGTDTKEIVLTVSGTAIEQGDNVNRVTYDKGTVVSADGGELASFLFSPVTNNVSLTLRTRDMTMYSMYISSALSDFPVRVLLNSVNFNFSNAQADGSDVWFRNDEGDLSFERVYHDGVSNEALYYVNIPAVSSTENTVFEMCYGDTSVPDKEDIAGTWVNYAAVYHYYNEGDSIVHDSLGSHNSNVFAGTFVIDYDGCGLEFNGTSDSAVEVPKHNNLIPANLTATAYWYAKGDGQSSASVIVAMARSTGGHSVWDHRLTPTNTTRVNAYASDATNYNISGATVASKDVWNKTDHIVDSSDSYRGTLYLNNVQQATSTSLTAALSTSFSNPLYMGGCHADSIANRRFQGILGALRISNVVRSQAYRDAETYYSYDDAIHIGAEVIADNSVSVSVVNSSQVVAADLSIGDHYISYLDTDTLLLDEFILTGSMTMTVSATNSSQVVAAVLLVPTGSGIIFVAVTNSSQTASADLSVGNMINVGVVNSGQIVNANISLNIIDVTVVNSSQTVGAVLLTGIQIYVSVVNSSQVVSADIFVQEREYRPDITIYEGDREDIEVDNPY